MKKALKITLLILALIFVALQFFQIDKSNPPIVQAETLEAITIVPPAVSIIFGKACNDCHTNKTIYPWYAYVQPAGWMLKDHIDEGRRKLNFSKFATYDTNKRSKKLEDVCEQVQSAEMPLPSYTWIHRDAVLTDSEKQALCDWTNGVRTLLSASPVPPATSGDKR